MDTDPTGVRERAARHHALGDPARLAIVDALVTGDLASTELGHALGLPSNLLAHHLKVLQDAGLVTRVRSHADRRRVYVRLNPTTLATLLPTPAITAPRVVFVCTRNGARSPMAAAIWAARSPVPAASAGTHPGPRVHPRAITTAQRHGVPLSQRQTFDAADLLTPDDLVITVCDNAHKALAPAHIHWSVPDPSPVDTDDFFDRVFDELDQRITWLAALTTTA
ncbi:helix-turn-helix domain-containing protein [Kitasatospora sp. NPDC051853]|uniref:arsenate reductase/protein-tyrosine-phosphatase family protein n=1 Tax=Kitasatospora sp. NPDC051853 TaxID=3364058 RepID=UPI003789BF67